MFNDVDAKYLFWMKKYSEICSEMNGGQRANRNRLERLKERKNKEQMGRQYGIKAALALRNPKLAEN